MMLPISIYLLSTTAHPDRSLFSHTEWTDPESVRPRLATLLADVVGVITQAVLDHGSDPSPQEYRLTVVVPTIPPPSSHDPR